MSTYLGVAFGFQKGHLGNGVKAETISAIMSWASVYASLKYLLLVILTIEISLYCIIMHVFT